MPLPPQAWVCCVVDSAHRVRQAHPRIKYGAGYERVNETMPAKAGIQRGCVEAWTLACGDLCATRAATPLNVILSPSATLRINYAKNPKGFTPRQRSSASKGFGFLTSLRYVRNDSRRASSGRYAGVTQRSPEAGFRRADFKALKAPPRSTRWPCD